MEIDRPDRDDRPRDRPKAGAGAGAGAGAADAGPGHDPASVALERADYGVQYRASVAAAYREPGSGDASEAADADTDAGAGAWDTAVTALREAWAEHELKWSATERSPGRTESAAAADAWRGDGGRRLGPDANAEVGRGCERIREVGESIITPALRRIEAEDPSRHLAGLEYRLKGKDRLKEKVARTLEEQPGVTAKQALSAVPDAVRFTFCYADKDYSVSVGADLDRLTAQGFELAKPLKNSWGSDQYKGINAQWREPETGQLFEIQFHTRASFEAKQISHGAYERIRSSQTPEAELDELQDYQRQVCGMIPVPPGATEVDYPVRKDRDG